MIFSLLFLLFQIFFGFLIFNFFDPEDKFSAPEKFLASVFLGIFLSSFLVLFFALILRSLNLGICLFFLLSLIFSLQSGKNLVETTRKLLSFLKNYKFSWLNNLWLLSFFSIFFLYYFFLSNLLFYREGKLNSALIGWGDNAFHVGLIEGFSVRNPFNLNHPVLAGANLNYHFMIDFISALYFKLGMDLLFAYRLPLYLFGPIFLIFLFSFSSKILNSKRLSLLVLVFVLFGSGFGFVQLFKDLKNLQFNFLQLLTNPPHEYTHLDNRTGGKPGEREADENIVWIVPVVSFLGHQRSFALGLSVFSFLLLAIFYYGKSKHFWRFGLLAGLLPFSHLQTFLSLFLFLSVLFFFHFEHRKDWLKFALVTCLFSLPQIIFFLKDTNFHLKPWFGWMTCEHTKSWFFCDPKPGTDSNPFWFWTKNFGLVFLVWVLFFFSKVFSYFKKEIEDKLIFGFVGASFFLFLIPNLFLLSPWVFDNNKVLFYWWILAIIFSFAPAIEFLFKKGFLGRILVIFLIFFGVFAGMFDFFSRFCWTKKFSSGYSDAFKENLELGKWIKENTKPSSIFLTAKQIDPPPLFLAGRPVYLGFEGWLFTEGLDYLRNQKMAEEFLKGDLKKGCEEKIEFILFDEELKKSFPEMNPEIILQKTETVFSQNTPFGERRILKVNCDKINQ